DILFAVNGADSLIEVLDGATVVASGTPSAGRVGNLVVRGTPSFLADLNFRPDLPAFAYIADEVRFNLPFVLLPGVVWDPVTSPGIDPNLLFEPNPDPLNGFGAVLQVTNAAPRLVERLEQRAGLVSNSRLTLTGAASLSGVSIGLESAQSISIGTEALLTADNLLIGAPNIAFRDGAANSGDFVIDEGLEALLSRAVVTTLSAPQILGFAAGDYSFNTLLLSVAGLAAQGPGDVNLTAGDVRIQNIGTPIEACGGTIGCGTGRLSIAAEQFTFGTGTTRAIGFGGGVTLAARDGMTYEADAAFDVGTAPLTLLTPFVVDAPIDFVPGSIPARPTLDLRTEGAVRIAAPGGVAAADVLASLPAGTPGAEFRLSANSLEVAGAVVRATAGSLVVETTGDIIGTGGAQLLAPGYARDFNDRDDLVVVSAPGGQLRLVSAEGSLGFAPDTLLSVGGLRGRAGQLVLLASSGDVVLGRVDAVAPEGSARLAIDSGGAFDLDRVLGQGGLAFTGEFDIRSGAGDLDLLAGREL
ncbi:MAG: hypothetical protein ACRC1J_10805, partial [Sandaracinobacteroides sp.]